MAIGTATALIGGSILGSVGGAAISSSAAKSAAKAAAAGDIAAIAEQKRQFDITQQRLEPYYNVGTQALGTLGGIYGYSAAGDKPLSYAEWAQQNPSVASSGAGSSGYGYGGYYPGNYMAYSEYANNYKPGQQTPSTDYSAFYQSPDYEFRRTEGNRGIEQSAAARGGAFSGNALKALNQYNSNLASGEFGNWWNRQASLAGIGQTATNTLANAGQSSANAIGSALSSAGDSRASGIAASTNAWGNALGQIGGLFGSVNWGGGDVKSTSGSPIGYGAGTNGLWS